MANVHPTALIDETVELADDAYVGPHCVLRGKVTIGPGTVLHGSAYLHGPLVIGRDCRIYPFACIGFSPQHRAWDPGKDGAGVIIGDRCVFRESAIVHRAMEEKPTTIGDDCYFMANGHAGHDSIVGQRVTVTHGAVLAGHVEVGDDAIIGGNGGVHQFARMGRLAIIAGVTAITQDLPPFCVFHHTRRVESLNLIGLRRAGLRQHVKPLQRAFDIVFKSGLSNQTAAQKIEDELGDDPLCMEMAAFIHATKRGICDGPA